MGYWSSPDKDLGSLYLNTQTPLKTPLCKQNFLLTLYSNSINNIQQARGKFTIYFKTSKELSTIYLFDDSDTTFKQNSIETRLLSFEQPIDNAFEIDSAFISYRKTTNLLSSWMYDSQWSFKYVSVLIGDNQKQINLCPLKPIIDSNETVEFKLC